MLPRRLDPVMRLALVRALGSVPECDKRTLGVDDIEGHDVQVRQRGHDFGMRVGVVERSVALGEGGGRGECRGGGDEMLDRRTTLVVGGRVGDGHILFHDVDVALGRAFNMTKGESKDGEMLTCSSSACVVCVFTVGDMATCL
jgi:hypothetical protein